ncbi:trehalose-phosphatase [Methylobacterium gnaphalii]|uniref:Trehalose 6-phosphate phosphatase n=1 Tax=Methylobacterium gnaphalii TaxID=1010610 RepID=A0A512JFJ8_9HYPH|nr:trehalose-phosphatase [Methylobacterium gnaphalii]GEP08713.1 putative trehalose-phosphate phosphatase [Methylobacterium gnaphalii]GJD69304.1 Trehalose-6-phosphate phosphatase [Methylobacterium gnaphalii]GLS47480.1 putative trehalose-phosphate phosphatase [Methylobacterium gnaphalii]
MSEPAAFAVFLDFDGTLAELAPTPDAVQVDPTLVPNLESLKSRLGGALAIVTGRPVDVIDQFLAPSRFDIAGLHGVERRVEGRLSGGRPEDHPALRAGVERLKAQTAALDKVLIEDKGASVAVHWRLANEADTETAQGIVKALASELGSAYRLQLGKAVGEVVPANATKGHAIRAFMEHPPYAGRRAIFFGDDKTDELAFESVNADGGVSVRIGDEETIARRRLAAPADVRALIAAWANGAKIDPDTLPPA